MADNNFDLQGFLNDPQSQANKPAAIQFLQSKGIIDKTGNPIPGTFKDTSSIQPSFKATVPTTTGGALASIPINLAKMVGNVPSDIGGIAQGAIIKPAQDIQQSEKVAGDIFSNPYQSKTQDVKDIASGFGKTASDIFQAPGKYLVNTNNKLDLENHLAPIQDATIKQRDLILQKIAAAKKTGGDVSHLQTALKYTMDTLNSLNSQIGSKEDRANDALNSITNIAKYPIEHPVQTGLAADSLPEGAQGAVSDTLKPITSPLESGINTAKNAVSSTADAVSNTASNIAKNSSIKDWTAPTTTPKGYMKATDIFNNAASKGNNIAETLTNNGIKLSDNIKNGVYTTGDTADAIRTDAAKTSNDLLRPSLENANYSTPKVKVDDIVADAKTQIANDKTMTPGDKQTAYAKLQKEGNALKGKYPDGMNLTDIHDNKITYSQNAGHNPIGTRADNITANSNNALATSLKTNLEDAAPKGIPVKQFNAELAKQYQSADYLDALNGKTAPRGIVSKIASTTAKVIGAGVGETLGGGILGGVGGYHIGGMVENLIENMSNPIKEYYLNNLQKTNPEAFAKVTSYLNDAEKARITTPKLGGPTPVGTSQNPIVPPVPTTYEAPAGIINRQAPEQQLQLPPGKSGAISSNAIQLGGITKDGYLIDSAGNKIVKPTQIEITEAKKYGLSMNPRTGKFQKVYSTSPK